MTHRTNVTLAAAGALLLAGCSGMRVVHPGSGSAQPPQTQTTVASPDAWQQARAHGMVFRAVGTDPPWEAEVAKGHAPTLFININNGMQQLTVPAVTVSADQATGTIYFHGETPAHPDVEMTAHRGQCQGNMAQDTASAAVTLTLDNRTLTGCGRFLF